MLMNSENNAVTTSLVLNDKTFSLSRNIEPYVGLHNTEFRYEAYKLKNRYKKGLLLQKQWYILGKL